MRSSDECLPLFVCGPLLAGEPDHPLLKGGQFLRSITTAPRYQLFEVGPYAALVEEGTTPVVGEMYTVRPEILRRLDAKREVGVLFERGTVELEDGTWAEAYLMPAERVRGKRRVRGGDWKKRFGPGPGGLRAGPFVSWTRSRNR